MPLRHVLQHQTRMDEIERLLGERVGADVVGGAARCGSTFDKPIAP